MAGFMTSPAKKALLDALVGKVLPWAAPRTTYLGLAVELPLQDEPTLGNITEVTTPGYARVAVTWDPATSVAPIFVDNTSALQFGPVTADMNPAAAYAFLTESSTGNVISVPALTLGSASAGGTFAAGTYYWKITAINARGETIGSNEVSATLTLNQQQVLNWGAISGATGYKVYRGTATGAQDRLVTTLGTVTTYTDTGSAGTPGATVPTANTAAVGDILYVWELAEPVAALASKPILVPVSGLVVE
jgi:hypothetical protein